MNSCKILCILILSIVVITLITNASSREQMDYDLDHDEVPKEHEHELNGELSHRLASPFSPSWFLRMKRTCHRSTCNKFPRICWVKGSPPYSCGKKMCVGLLADRLNCGMCGKKRKYNEICCEGKRGNPSFSRKHSGGCNNGCNGGNFCLLGLCNYVQERRRIPERGFTWSDTVC